MITVVMGSFGVGKTHWIQEKIKENKDNNFYYSPKTNTFPLDGAFLQTINHELSIIEVKSPQELIVLGENNNLYIEIPQYVEFTPIKSLFDQLNWKKSKKIKTTIFIIVPKLTPSLLMVLFYKLFTMNYLLLM